MNTFQQDDKASEQLKDIALKWIPEEWGMVTVDDIAKITTGGKDTQDRDDSADYPFFVRSQSVERISSFSFDGEAVLTAGDGVGVGKVFHYYVGKFDFHQRVYCIHSFAEGMSGSFFFQYFRHNFMSRMARFSAKGSVDSVRMEMISNMVVPKPPKPEQTKIAEILSTVDRAIEQTESSIAKQQRIKTGLMQDLLTRGIDEHGNLRSEQTHKFKDSPLGRIPVEWNPSQISSAATLQRGHDITENDLRNGPYPVISSGGVIGYHAECTSKGPNVVVGRKGTIGRVHYLEHDFWAHDTSLYVTNFKGNNEQYIFYLFSHLDLARYGTKSGSPSLNRNDIHPLWIGLPLPDEQGMIAAILKRCDLGLDSLGRRSEKLRAIKTALMQDLLTGKKRITVLLNSSMPTN